ncbi:hypothetical protein CSC2_13950 [Clostridium zeae]|uniref:Condensation domain-containing protein n=1 Tax=Clostridium zeae TaxID=2759022 RepID=A0ABQ1E850_9CLOT|nr:condensation domain-containing protein [Clostridium zeae]GFZ30869.1 hypothetical protein CSC2_13950 [Clostridium zeae]
MEKKSPLLAERIHYRSVATNMTFSAELLGKYNHTAMLSAVKRLPQIHPILNINVVQEDDGNIYYTYGKHYPTLRLYSEDTRVLIKVESKRSFSLKNECLLRIFVQYYEDYFSVVMVAHHIMGDARSIMILLNDLLELYGGKSVEAIDEPVLLPLSDQFPEEAKLSTRQQFYVDYLNTKWKKEKRLFSDKEFDKVYSKFYESHDICFESLCLKKDETNVLHSKCKEHKVTITSALAIWVLRSIYETLSDFFSKDMQVNIPVSVKKEFNFIPQRCVGNYCSNISLKYTYKEMLDFWEEIEWFHEKMTQKLNDNKEKYMSLNMMMAIDGSLQDAISFSTFGDFDSLIAKQMAELFNVSHSSSNIEISNVGQTSINKLIGKNELRDILYIPPRDLSNILTLGVIGFHDRINLCVVYDAAVIPKSKITDLVNSIMKICN